MNAFIVVGALMIAAGVVQVFFRRPLAKSSESAARSVGLPDGVVARSWPTFLLTRCAPLWVVGAGLLIVGLTR
jgi:hypothetical protein